jgi:hypothetical protein
MAVMRHLSVCFDLLVGVPLNRSARFGLQTTSTELVESAIGYRHMCSLPPPIRVAQPVTSATGERKSEPHGGAIDSEMTDGAR